MLKKVGKLALGGNGFVILAVFDAELHATLACMGDRFTEKLQDARGVYLRHFFACLDRLEFSFDEFAGEIFPLLDHFTQRGSEVEGADASGVHHDKGSAEFFSPVDGGQGQTQGAVAVFWPVGGELITIGRVGEDFDRHGQEIVNAGDTEFAALAGLQHAFEL